MNNFRTDFCAISQCGILDNGGVTRLALSSPDYEARNYLIKAMRHEGLEVRIDAAGNIHGLWAGSQPELAPLMLGSHLDTVPSGGHYDGVVGVLAGLEVIRRLRKNTLQPKRSIELVNFCAEESSRFGVATLGSKSITGKLTVKQLQQLKDAHGISFYESLKQGGCQVDLLAQDQIKPGDIHSFIELHIEQGRVLEQQGVDIGLVSAIAAPTRFDVFVSGRSDHSGNTPMHMRHDALAAAAEIVLEVESIATAANSSSVGTVGVLEVEPGAMNVVPGKVHLQIDIRSIDAQTKNTIVAQLKDKISVIENKRKLEIALKTLCDEQPVHLSQDLRKQLSRIAERTGLTSMELPSGAGHDAMHFVDIAPTALLFIPSIEGISHNIREQSTFEAIEKGTELLYASVLELADE